MRLHLLGIVSLFAAPLVACQPPDPAPEDLSELLRFTFSHNDTEDAAYDVSLADAAVNLLTWWETEAERAEDFDAALGYGASLIEEEDRLSEAELETLDPPPEGVRGADAVGVIVAMRTACNLDDIERIYLDDDQSTLFPDSYLSYDRSEQQYDCYLDRDCPEATWVSAIEQGIFGNLTASYELNNQLRGLEAEAPDGTLVRALLVRAWLREGAELSDPNLGGWHQNYQLEFMIETDSGLLHVYPQWVEVEISNVDTEAGWLLGQYISGLRDYLRQAEEHCTD